MTCASRRATEWTGGSRARAPHAGVLLALLLASPAAADDNHHQNYLLGERAVGLGGAFTAISDDSSGAYYNPAGLAEAPYSSVSLSAAVYGFASQSASAPGIDGELTQSTFITYPTTAAWIQILRRGDPATGAGRMQLAISLVTPQSSVRRERVAYQQQEPSDDPNQQLFSSNYSVNLVEDDALWFGVSYAYKPHSRISFGATLFTTLRTGLYHFYDLQLLSLVEGGLESDRLMLPNRAEARLRHIGMLGVLGAQIRLSDALRLGLAFRTPLAQLSGSIAINNINLAAEAAGAVRVESTDVNGTFNDRQPFKATVGLAYLRPRAYGVSLDFSLYGPQSQYLMVSDTGDAEIDNLLPMKKRLLWQLNVGGEYYLRQVVPLRAGFFTNLSSLDPCDAGNTGCNEVFGDGVDRFGFAGSVGYEMKRATLTFATSYNFGSASNSYSGITVDERRSFLLFTVGASFRFEPPAK